jgi:molybdopterin synthase sulfur carrier subunit
MAIVRLFAAARDAAGTGRDQVPGDTVGDVLAEARRRYGERFEAVLASCRIWVNGEPADDDDTIGPADELAVLPPVSGGATEHAPGRATARRTILHDHPGGSL